MPATKSQNIRVDELFVPSFTISNNCISPIHRGSFVSNLFVASEVQKTAAQLQKWLFQELEMRPAILRGEVG